MTGVGHVFEFTSACDGLRLVGRRWEPSGAPRAVLQIAHGMAEHCARYAWVAERFTERGWLVVAHDHRGHGQSVPSGEAPGHMADRDGWNRAVLDLAQLAGELRATNPGLPLVLLAHSMGSFMGQQLIWQAPGTYDAVALSGSNGPPPAIATLGNLIARFERWRLGPSGKSQLLHALSFGDFNKPFEPARTDVDWLSRDPAQVDLYVADPWCGFPVSAALWVDLLDALPRLTAPEHLRLVRPELPIRCFAGARDPVGAFGAGVKRLAELYRAAGVRDVQLQLYPDARHETLNETNRDEVVSDLVTWAEAVVTR